MLLTDLKLLQQQGKVNISITGDMITAVGHSVTGNINGDAGINFHDAVAFPGLINSHDHLDFNCFPLLSDRVYKNYTEWGNHIHTVYKNDIEAVLRIPEKLRVQWGMYKNLLAGVTTVVNHGDVLKIDDPLINIIQEPQSLHSVKFEKQWKRKLNNPFLKNKICVIHTGEGVDESSAKEIDELLKWNLLNRKLVGVHAVAMNAEQAKQFDALVWCPESNQVLLNETADIKILKTATSIVFGTDSTLTGNWNIWEHLRLARKKQFVTDAELFDMVTEAPAKLWNSNAGEISANSDADIVIARTGNENISWNDLFNIDPVDILMVIQKGRIRLFDQELLAQLSSIDFDGTLFYPIAINGMVKYVHGNLPSLIDSIRSYYPKASFPCNGYGKIKITTHA